MNTILTPADARKLGRPIGKVSDDKVQAFISEIEQTIIRRRLGDKLFLELLTTDHEKVNTYDILLNGGTYVNKFDQLVIVNGLKKAEAYYVYAQNVRNGDFESTRYGMVHKDDEYSNPITDKERDGVANSTTEIANAYMDEVLTYCISAGFLDPRDSGMGMGITSGCIIRKIKY